MNKKIAFAFTCTLIFNAHSMNSDEFETHLVFTQGFANPSQWPKARMQLIDKMIENVQENHQVDEFQKTELYLTLTPETRRHFNNRIQHCLTDCQKKMKSSKKQDEREKLEKQQAALKLLFNSAKHVGDY